MFSARGELLDPLSSGHGKGRVDATGYQKVSDPAGAGLVGDEAYFHRILEAIARSRADHPRAQVLFFFHGGLNSRAAALKRAAEQLVLIRQERADIYPIFVNWETSLPASYKDHLLWVRNGQDTYQSGALVTPFVLVSDISRSILDIPTAGYMQFKEQQRYRSDDPEDAVVRLGTDEPCERLDFRAGHNDVRTTVGKIKYWASSVVMTVLTKWWVGGLLSATGSSAWSSMLYTSDRLFYSDEELHHPYKYVGHVTGAGAFSQFLRELSGALKKTDDVVLVGHSAGTIVANRLIANFRHTLPISTLVYMGAACTIDNIMEGGVVTQFLREQQQGVEQQRAHHLYLLTLNERSEVNEQWFLDATPRGTLLAWLDEFIQPKHSEFPGMMLGRARNLRLHAHLIPCDIRSQISISAFNEQLSANPTEPQRHGSFGDLHYWNEATWYPSFPGIEPVPNKP